MKKKMTSRRELLRNTVFSGAALAAASLITSCTKSEEKKPAAPAANTLDEPVEPAATDLPYVDPASNKAKALRYVENASEAPAEVKVDKGETKAADQNCTNCQFYSDDNGNGGGKCALFPGKLVKAEGWCVSWSLKAQS
jgi:hypothetical protein